ncbi:hypothetical protein IV203_033654 [Nitzschia inconspicua]|uniref:DUF4371 domain-containing protein n=1 Tax=Nitzschia inconspicua TaxID=303405 RepID=A0A9K3M3Z5_9STRA|nr:hypothetical protein IV203_033654 [Nitzschia inconspicua]
MAIRQKASKLYQSVKEETGMGVLGSVSDVEVAQHCRTVCAINLQYLKEIFNDIWAFAIAIDAGNNAGTAYLDLRMRCYYKGSLEYLHILAIPMREHHTGEYQYDLIVETMNVLAPDWRHQLIGITTDGASTMTGCIQGTCTRLSNECHGNIFRVWCGAHQLDLVVKKAFNQLMNKKFLITLTGVTGHLRRQQNLIQHMKSSCPTFATTPWISMGKVLKWFKANRIRLFQHFSEKKPACTPSMEWWLVDIKERCYINGPMTDEESISFLAAVNNDPLHGFHLNNYCVLRQEAASSIDEVERFVQLTMDGLRSSSSDADKEAHDCIISTIANF